MTVVVCIDNTSSSDSALFNGIDLANKFGEDLLCVHGVSGGVSSDGGFVKRFSESEIDSGLDLLSAVQSDVRDRVDNDVCVELIDSPTADHVVDSVAEFLNDRDDVSYVCVGYRDLGGKVERAVGSFSKRLVSLCRHPVVVC